MNCYRVGGWKERWNKRQKDSVFFDIGSDCTVTLVYIYSEREGCRMYNHVAYRFQTILNLSDIFLMVFIVVRTTWRVHGVENCGFLMVNDFSLKFLNGPGCVENYVWYFDILYSSPDEYSIKSWLEIVICTTFWMDCFFYMFAIIISCQVVWTFEKYELVHCIKVVWTTQVNINNLCLLVIFFFSIVKIIYYFSFYTLKQREKMLMSCFVM